MDLAASVQTLLVCVELKRKKHLSSFSCLIANDLFSDITIRDSLYECAKESFDHSRYYYR